VFKNCSKNEHFRPFLTFLTVIQQLRLSRSAIEVRRGSRGWESHEGSDDVHKSRTSVEIFSVNEFVSDGGLRLAFTMYLIRDVLCWQFLVSLGFPMMAMDMIFSLDLIIIVKGRRIFAWENGFGNDVLGSLSLRCRRFRGIWSLRPYSISYHWLRETKEQSKTDNFHYVSPSFIGHYPPD